MRNKQEREMEKIKVNTDSLKSTSESVRTQIKNIRDALATMKTDVTTLNGMWTGSANASFNDTFQKDIDDLDTLLGKMDDIAKYEENARSEYVKCENTVAGIISGINV